MVSILCLGLLAPAYDVSFRAGKRPYLPAGSEPVESGRCIILRQKLAELDTKGDLAGV
jgi:hypothetical protein